MKNSWNYKYVRKSFRASIFPDLQERCFWNPEFFSVSAIQTTFELPPFPSDVLFSSQTIKHSMSRRPHISRHIVILEIVLRKSPRHITTRDITDTTTNQAIRSHKCTVVPNVPVVSCAFNFAQCTRIFSFYQPICRSTECTFNSLVAIIFLLWCWEYGLIRKWLTLFKGHGASSGIWTGDKEPPCLLSTVSCVDLACKWPKWANARGFLTWAYQAEICNAREPVGVIKAHTITTLNSPTGFNTLLTHILLL